MLPAKKLFSSPTNVVKSDINICVGRTNFGNLHCTKLRKECNLLGMSGRYLLHIVNRLREGSAMWTVLMPPPLLHYSSVFHFLCVILRSHYPNHISRYGELYTFCFTRTW